MAVLKCKMCGADLNIAEGSLTTECEYCGTTQTVPVVDNEKKVNLFNRANRLRMNSEFDKAASIYEQIIAEFPEEAEAYWGLCLCNYGIEYVDDPASGNKIPTCHRASFTKIADDENFSLAMEYADIIQQRLYRNEARVIDEIMENILSISRNEKPYDIFICYKETDEKGERTIDSVIGFDIYEALTAKGYKVFFSRVSLEDKLGKEYEPYIFAALNSAKVMLSLGTKYEYFHAVWVKNEWSRFLKLMASDKSKALIPCFKDMDAYDMPDEFKALQAQDMGKVGAIQDLVRGVEKILGSKSSTDASASAPVIVQQTGPNVESLIKRVFMFLEDGKWSEADNYCEKVLDIDPENARAYLGKLMANLHINKEDELKNTALPFDKHDDCIKASRFDSNLAEKLKEDNNYIRERNELKRKTDIYNSALSKMNNAKTEDEYQSASEAFSSITGFKDAEEKARLCLEKSKEAREIAEEKRRKVEEYKAEQKRKAEEERRKAEEESERKAEELRLLREKLAPFTQLISAGYCYSIGIKSDGTVVAAKYPGYYNYGQRRVRSWKDIVAVSTGAYYTVGLKKYGTVVAVGSNDYGQCNVTSWTNIVAVAAGSFHTVGLKKDGTVVATRYTGDYYNGQCDVEIMTDIVAVAAGNSHTVGLKKDGTVVAVGTNFDGCCDVESWTDIVAIAAEENNTVGLKKDGTVVATSYYRHVVKGMTDIVAISAGGHHIAGLKSDGTVVVVGRNGDGQCDVESWKDIVAVSANDSHTIGLKKDGTVVATIDIGDEKDSHESWKLFDGLEFLEDDQEIKPEKRAKLEAEKSLLRTELVNLVGLFTGKRRKEIEARIAQIENEISELNKEK